MDKKLWNAWLRVSITEVRQGATYEGVIYDQDLVVKTTNGDILTLFDMAPMIAIGVQIGEVLDVIVAISTPSNLKREGRSQDKNVAIIDSIDCKLSQNESARFRIELFGRRWCKLKTSSGHFLMATTEIIPAFPKEITSGESISWEGGRLDLMAWKYAT